MAESELRQRSKDKSKNGANSETDSKSNYWDPLIEGVKWIEKYSDSMDSFFGKLPHFINTLVATLAVFTFGATLRGKKG